MDEFSKEASSSTIQYGLPDPRSMFDENAYEKTGLKREYQLKPEDLPLKPGDTFLNFGRWVSCVKPIGSNFCVAYDLDSEKFTPAAFIGVDTRAVSSPRKVDGIDAIDLSRKYKESQMVLNKSEVQTVHDDTDYTLKSSDLERLKLELITTDGSFEGKKYPSERRRIKLGSYEDIEIDESGRVSEHIIIPGRKGTPTVVVGDWHQAIIPELPILRGLGLLPKDLPVQVDWLDEHIDEYAEDFHPLGGIYHRSVEELAKRSLLLEYPKTVKDSLQKVKGVHCGRAALPISGKVTHVTSPLIFKEDIPSNWLDLFHTANPFSRKSNQPHVLSLDCDFFDYWCRNTQNPQMQQSNFRDLTKFLVEDKGLDFTQYDAVMIYTSPKYCKPEMAQNVVNFTLSSLPDSNWQQLSA